MCTYRERAGERESERARASERASERERDLLDHIWVADEGVREGRIPVDIA